MPHDRISLYFTREPSFVLLQDRVLSGITRSDQTLIRRPLLSSTYQTSGPSSPPPRTDHSPGDCSTDLVGTPISCPPLQALVTSLLANVICK